MNKMVSSVLLVLAVTSNGFGAMVPRVYTQAGCTHNPVFDTWHCPKNYESCLVFSQKTLFTRIEKCVPASLLSMSSMLQDLAREEVGQCLELTGCYKGCKMVTNVARLARKHYEDYMQESFARLQDLWPFDELMRALLFDVPGAIQLLVEQGSMPPVWDADMARLPSIHTIVQRMRTAGLSTAKSRDNEELVKKTLTFFLLETRSITGATTERSLQDFWNNQAWYDAWKAKPAGLAVHWVDPVAFYDALFANVLAYTKEHDGEPGWIAWSLNYTSENTARQRTTEILGVIFADVPQALEVLKMKSMS